MAGPFYKRPGFIMRAIITLPILWFAFIGVTVVFTGSLGGGSLDASSADHINSWKHPEAIRIRSLGASNDNEKGAGDADAIKSAAGLQQPPKQPVIEKPDMDKLRFEEQMRNDMAKELRKKSRRFHNHPEMPEPVHMEQVPIPVNDNKPGSTKSTTHDPNGPGEMGKAIVIDKDKLSPEERKKYDLGFQNNAFNQYASDLMSLHRTLPDVRDEECKSVVYPKDLPDTSVVVIFHNEAFTILQRTVFSVLDRSPPEYLKEIILVDDCSDFDHLKKPLDDFVASIPKLRLVRSPQREGLIRARLRGAAVAKGKVITFLDSHCEATIGWLEPLLSRIGENISHVVTPVIDVINDDNLQYQFSSAKTTSVGGFDWNLQFNWHAIPEHERKRRKSDVEPIRSPTMAGGLFAISKEYFEYLGTYDAGMDIWGGENLELSFRTWMCGGTLEIMPCSHVGHIFRKRSPYSWKTGVNVVKKNSIRVAEVWMDQHKFYYYERFNNDLGDYGDVTARKELRQKLGCKSFDWYLKNVYPEQFVPGEALASGEIRLQTDLAGRSWCLDASADKNAVAKHEAIKMWPCHKMGGNQVRNEVIASCLDASVENEALNKNEQIKMWPCHRQGGNQVRCVATSTCLDAYASGEALKSNEILKMWPCHNKGGNQYWMLSKNGEIRRDEGCMDYAGQHVMIYPCHGMHGNQEWLYGLDGTIRQKHSNLCMEVSPDGKNLEMKPCTGVDRQRWQWKRKEEKKSEDVKAR